MNRGDLQQPVDVVIVGAGAAGGVFAATLARAGKSIHILEAGPPWTRDDLVSSQIWARRLKWGGTSAVRGGDNPYSHNIIHGWGTGGAALHHYGTWPRMHPESFHLHSTYGVGLDWPIDYDTLRPWYDRVQREVGISGDRAQEPWRAPGEPYPMPPLIVSEQARRIGAGFKALGKSVAPLPAIINSQPYNGRPSCLYDGWCDAGCPIGALGNPLETYLGTALRHEGVRLDNHCTVSRVLIDKRGHARGVEYFRGGQRYEQRAAVVVLAGSVVQNPRMLLNSASTRFPAGLANHSGLVGRYLDVEIMTAAYGLFEQPTHPYLGVNAGGLIYREKPAPSAAGKPFGGYQWQIGPAMKPNDLFGVATTRVDLFGEDLQRFVQRGAHHIGNMVGFGGTHTRRDNRVELVATRDRAGLPLARVINTFVPASKALLDHMQREGEAVLRAAGADEVWGGPAGTGHTVGGTIMGADPARSVTDSYGRCHDVDNLFLAGAGIMPSGGGTSPTYTIHALSLRAAEHLRENWSQYAAVAA